MQYPKEIKLKLAQNYCLKKVFCTTKMNDNNFWSFRLYQISHVISHGFFLLEFPF